MLTIVAFVSRNKLNPKNNNNNGLKKAISLKNLQNQDLATQTLVSQKQYLSLQHDEEVQSCSDRPDDSPSLSATAQELNNLQGRKRWSA